MDEIKIGDIVEPTTPVKKQQLGTGIVIAVKQASRVPVSVIFAPKKDTMIFRQFSESSIKVVEVNAGRQQELSNTVQRYEELNDLMKSA